MVEPFSGRITRYFGDKIMPSKNQITVGAKISEIENECLVRLANRENISVSAILKLCIGGIMSGDIDIEKGELKIGVNPIGYAVCDDFYADDFGRKVEKKFDRLREREYPEEVIDMLKAEILAGIDNRIDMLPKKFDRRKMRDGDVGA